MLSWSVQCHAAACGTVSWNSELARFGRDKFRYVGPCVPPFFLLSTIPPTPLRSRSKLPSSHRILRPGRGVQRWWNNARQSIRPRAYEHANEQPNNNYPFCSNTIPSSILSLAIRCPHLLAPHPPNVSPLSEDNPPLAQKRDAYQGYNSAIRSVASGLTVGRNRSHNSQQQHKSQVEWWKN